MTYAFYCAWTVRVIGWRSGREMQLKADPACARDAERLSHAGMVSANWGLQVR
jgi:hypothetical protein